MQPEPSLPQEPSAVSPVAEAKKVPRKINFLVILLVILLLALIGVGIWAFTLHTALKATQADLATLQGKYDSLTTEKNELSDDFNATSSELEKIKGDLSVAQSDLSKSKDETAALREKMDKASLYMDVAVAFFIDNARDSSLVEKITATHDSKLKDRWDTLKATPMDLSSVAKLTAWSNALKEFEGYLLETIADLLK